MSSTTIPRTLHLPPQRLTACGQCGTTSGRLALCSACGERAYCSRHCQAKDWSNHKAKCVPADRLDLGAFYPFLGVLTHYAHEQQAPLHPALNHVIMNAPLPAEFLTALPDGTAAKLIMLGDPIPERESWTPAWWPLAENHRLRCRMARRITYEGFLAPILTALAITLMEAYITPADPAPISLDGKPKLRPQLRYENSPIVDFGIAMGKLDVKFHDKLAYFNVNDLSFLQGQDPDDHYWFYFTTLKGEETTLDLGMYTFNFSAMVQAKPYCVGAIESVDAVPAFLRTRDLARLTPKLTEEKKRFSVLRNKALQKLAARVPSGLKGDDVKVVYRFMDRLAGRECNRVEKEFVIILLNMFQKDLRHVLATRAWSEWPKDPTFALEQDPKQRYPPGGVGDSWFKYLKKWQRAQGTDGITKESFTESYRSWQKKYCVPPDNKE